MARVAIHTLGCKLNYAESSAIGKEFLEKGFRLVPFGQPAEVNVINTCSVTARADQECRQMIRRALRVSPDSFVVVTGCYAQLAPEQIGAIEGVDLVVGSREKYRLFTLAGDMQKLSCADIRVGDIKEAEEFRGAATSAEDVRTRAFLKIQDGCDYSCSFCTIPKARGRSRSQGREAVLDDVRRLVDQGFKEVVLTGVNVGDYQDADGTTLMGLLRGIVEIDGMERIRISSIEPNLLTDDIVELTASNRKLCKHFHVPLQSGSSSVLKRMRRRYGGDTFRGRVEKVKQLIPECGVGVDVIVGFPGETESEFEETRSLLVDLPLSYLHVFTYSDRAGTISSGMDVKVPSQVKGERNSVLRALSEGKREAFAKGFIGKSVDVLLESEVDAGLRYGLSGAYLRVGIPEQSGLEGEIVRVRIKEVRSGFAIGVREGA